MTSSVVRGVDFYQQATVAYHNSQVMIANAMIISGSYKNEKIPRPDNPDEMLTEEEVLNTYIIRMKTHASALLNLRKAERPSSVPVLISECTDQNLSMIYGSDVLDRVRDQHIQFEWINLPIPDKVLELNEAYQDIHGRPAPNVIIEV